MAMHICFDNVDFAINKHATHVDVSSSLKHGTFGYVHRFRKWLSGSDGNQLACGLTIGP